MHGLGRTTAACLLAGSLMIAKTAFAQAYADFTVPANTGVTFASPISYIGQAQGATIDELKDICNRAPTCIGYIVAAFGNTYTFERGGSGTSIGGVSAQLSYGWRYDAPVLPSCSSATDVFDKTGLCQCGNPGFEEQDTTFGCRKLTSGTYEDYTLPQGSLAAAERFSYLENYYEGQDLDSLKARCDARPECIGVVGQRADSNGGYLMAATGGAPAYTLYGRFVSWRYGATSGPSCSASTDGFLQNGLCQCGDREDQNTSFGCLAAAPVPVPSGGFTRQKKRRNIIQPGVVRKPSFA